MKNFIITLTEKMGKMLRIKFEKALTIVEGLTNTMENCSTSLTLAKMSAS